MDAPTAANKVYPIPHDLFQRYVQAVSGNTGYTISQDHAAEVRERLEQLDFILERVAELEAAEAQLGHQLSNTMSHLVASNGQVGLAYVVTSQTPGADAIMMGYFQQVRRLAIEVRTLTEAFYYMAFRIFQVVTDKPGLPFLGGFKCVGVRNVRNHLIEHPEGKSSGVTSSGHSFGSKRGPVLKPSRPLGKENVFPDNGLYANAAEFMANFARTLEIGIAMAMAYSSSLGSPPGP